MLYILMLAFQLAGALLLLLNCLNGTKNTVIKNCFPGTNTVERDENNNCTIPKEKLQGSAHKIYLNIVAFIDLVLGYGIAVFSPEAKFKTCYTAIIVAGFTIVLLFIGYFGSLLVAKILYRCDQTVSYSILEENNVDTQFTDTEVNDKWNKVFKCEVKENG